MIANYVNANAISDFCAVRLSLMVSIRFDLSKVSKAFKNLVTVELRCLQRAGFSGDLVRC